MLSAEESRSTGAVRMRIAKQLAEVFFTINVINIIIIIIIQVLLHGVSEAQYTPPESGDSPRRVSSRQGSADSPWKPRK